jgi:DNA-binding MarR family transcriptional regulator
MGWPRGDFDFFPNVGAAEETIKTPTEQLLKEAAQRAEEWKQMRSVISSTEAVFRLSPGGMVSAISLQPEEWHVLAHVNGATSIAEIATQLGEDELAVAKILSRLAKAGLLEAGEKPKGRPTATIGAEFFSKLNDEFVEIMGPLGPTIIDETIAALGETRESFPREKVAALVERMSADISAEPKRVQFQQIMLDVLKKV